MRTAETVFTYAAPGLKFGPGASDEIGHDVAQTGARRVLVVTDPGVAATGHPARVAERIAERGLEVTTYDRARVEPTDASLSEAIEHVNRHGTGHSEAIVTSSDEVADEFTSAVDAACVYVNASTRFTDGFEFGMGAEIGNSTQKLHARGPIGLPELTSTTYVVEGDGHIRR